MSNSSQTYPSIFNDVIGPVMRGPSSSHCAAAVRIGKMVRDLMDREIKDVLIEFDPDGSLATTHESQGSDMGLFAGFLGWDATDGRLADSPKAIQEAGITVKTEITPIDADHPNTYKMTVTNSRETHRITAISTGGGIIEVIEIDSVKVSMAGDYYETLIYFESDKDRLLVHLNENISADEIHILHGEATQLIEIKSQGFFDQETISELRSKFDIQSIKQIMPVLPVLTFQGIEVPFITCAEMMAYNRNKNLNLSELAVHYERSRGAITDDQVTQKMADIIDIMQNAIHAGLAGTEYADRILGYQSGKFQSQMENRHLIDGGVLNQIILYTTALMESKSAMGLIVAAPTAGACGGLPGACIGAASALGLVKDDMTRAMLAGGIIGVFIASHATFAAEVGGCQAECGAGSGMAAAALVTLAGGSTHQAVNAASMALQNILGMICDPVANRVEVPCLGKNVMAASNALACANMALADYDPVIPLDEVIQTMDEVGKMLPSAFRCTALGGLSITKTSKEIEKRLAQKDD
ncbi:MAG: L-serine ammonia-lyase, iron-sulfur-dependent, subunit alpha [Desulfobacterales bacterium]|nr:L-serine ammonia-lyase, iron-sulfur-dependent, subunit alpha [Desulfobacterales bacterium]MDX2509475.1 L-serine ammonia-lyase, iron-sulfur-dependent, subunit alpha [Desulfobacterales bacterium]